MSTKTQYYDLELPENSDKVAISTLNQNFSKIDETMHDISQGGEQIIVSL